MIHTGTYRTTGGFAFEKYHRDIVIKDSIDGVYLITTPTIETSGLTPEMLDIPVHRVECISRSQVNVIIRCAKTARSKQHSKKKKNGKVFHGWPLFCFFLVSSL